MNIRGSDMAGDRRDSVQADPRWNRIVVRDKSADGSFWYSVLTTGVYCRPSCPSKLANPRNVLLHDSLEDAQKTGFRACKRCNPGGASREAEIAALMAKACRMIEQNGQALALETLAERLGLSAGHFHRLFKISTGLTPKAYAKACQAARIRRTLTTGKSVTEAIYAAGFNSSGRFYEQSAGMLGMTPSAYREGGAGEEIRFAVGQSALGPILVASSRIGIAAILIGSDPEVLVRDLQDQFPQAKLIGGDADYEALVAKVVGFVEMPAIGLDLPLDIRGTAFQQRVWQALREIPAGRTVSYSELSRALGLPKAVRAVAGACASNRIAVAIPCHRVVRNDGTYSGYRWGVERKRALLEREAATP